MPLKKLLGFMFSTGSKLAFFSIIGQAIGVLNFIVAARLYGQDAVGVYAVFLAICAILSSISILSLERNIPNMKESDFSIFSFGALFILIVFSTLSLVGLWAFDYEFYFFSALYILIMGIFRLCIALNIRNRSFNYIMLSRVFPNMFLLCFLLAGITIKQDEFRWLIISQVSSMLLFVIWHSWQSFKSMSFVHINLFNSLNLVLNEWKFMVYVAPSELMNRLSLQLPIIIIEHFFGNLVTAQYALVLKICLSPISVVCTAIGQVFQADLAYLSREKVGSTYKTFISLTAKLLALAGVLSALLYWVAPSLILVIFGGNWTLSSQFIKILSPLVLIMIIVAPLSTALYVYREHVTLLISQSLFFLVSLFSFIIAGITDDIILGIVLFSFLSFIRYGFIYLKIKHAILLRST